jgi:TonB family protein
MKTRLHLAFIAAALFGVFALVGSASDTHDWNPLPISQAAPDYPFAQNRDGIEGAVLVHYHVNAHGDVVYAVVAKSTDKAFEKPALAAIRSWKFIPETMTGEAVDVPVLQLVTFRVNSQSERLQPRRSSPV